MGETNNQLNRVGVTATAAKNRLICKQPTTNSISGSMLMIRRTLAKMLPGGLISGLSDYVNK